MSLWDTIDQHQPSRPSEVALQKFGEYTRAVQNPGVLLDDLDRGLVSPEVLETWEALYPDELAEIRAMVTSEVERKLVAGHQFDELEIRTLDKLLGTRDDSYVAEMQRNYEDDSDGAKSGQPGAPVNISKQMATATDKAREGRY